MRPSTDRPEPGGAAIFASTVGGMRSHLRRGATVLVVSAALLLVGGPPAAAAGRWRAPLDGRLVVDRGFEPPPRDWLPGHRGVDLVATPGAVVRAAGAGVVTFAGILAGRGVVAVTHGDLRTTYEPLVVAVGRGDEVEAGSPLGRLAVGHGDPGPGDALLHWGLRRGEVYLDPVRLLGQGPVRLLPRWAVEPAMRAEPGSVRPRVASASASAPEARPVVDRSRGRPRAGTTVVLAMAAAAAVAATRGRRR
ncbi:MAG TPA: M23 family metallopeptidase [Mycobacteriales bacterium]|nr:M23 family metallopeptidase [Mycobacteriales bacterium]